MKSSPLMIVVDADALVAQTTPDDANFQVAQKISQKIIDRGCRVVYPVTAVAEAATVLQRKLKNPMGAYAMIKMCTNPSLQIIDVTQAILTSALRYFDPEASRKNTLFDCIVAAVAQTVHADAIFSFDRFYNTCGFRLASELL